MGQKLAAFDAQGTIIGFYDEVDSPAPDDARVVEITDDQWAELLAGQSRGERLTIDDAGHPQLLPPLPPSPEQIVVQNTLRRNELLTQASVALAPLQMAVALGEATDPEIEAARQWLAFTRMVKAVDLTLADAEWPSAPEIAGSN
ncbi:tail fiber assembly protein [Burkholderia multivorans]|uniref:tail fiber assembly protein n=1 Tax=Burkholderia multivorans TaxID=87883 RepID=UPI000CFE9116|nr:tail fiber assembly protein [Burkholderia multivorans]MBN6732787.1 tail fiber assembly protein [Burkholderia multivorans]MBN8167090.1 tail fiber assembly protein [Burkholderia multivorans]MBN8172883.1 tail fiber assembly protein [Burkholderia multivorans]MBN8178500.1 tail fiber assembly protein [Burkholderia multivorans]MCL4628519.1 tail fiber assembly protein [Burkholderia multivorans]